MVKTSFCCRCFKKFAEVKRYRPHSSKGIAVLMRQICNHEAEKIVETAPEQTLHPLMLLLLR